MVPAIVFFAVPGVLFDVCEVYKCRHLNRGYLLWFSYAVSFGGVFFNVYVVLPKQDTTIE